MAKFRVSMEHGIPDDRLTYDTSATLEAATCQQAISALVTLGLRQGHDVRNVTAYLVEDEKGGDSGNA